jgi:hypothetical protein
MTNDKSAPRVLSRKSSSESERTPKDAKAPRVSDTLLNVTDAPDADYHTEALANAVADSEAGVMPDSEQGGITPLKRKGKT